MMKIIAGKAQKDHDDKRKSLEAEAGQLTRDSIERMGINELRKVVGLLYEIVVLQRSELRELQDGNRSKIVRRAGADGAPRTDGAKNDAGKT